MVYIGWIALNWPEFFCIKLSSFLKDGIWAEVYHLGKAIFHKVI